MSVPQVEAIVGELDEQRSVIFPDDDGGWYRSTTGQPPIPFPWPSRKGPDLDGLVTGGVIDSGMEDGRFLVTWATKPADTAQQLGIRLSDAAANGLISAGASAPPFPFPPSDNGPKILSLSGPT
ncbi:MAG: hypothetical protein ACJ786_37450 [Catenulispora sp.]